MCVFCMYYTTYIDFHFCGKALELLCQHRDYLKQVVSFSAKYYLSVYTYYVLLKELGLFAILK